MEPFRVEVRFSGNRVYRMDVTQKMANETMERYEVRAKNHCFLLDTNRPLLLRKGEAHLPWEWRLVAGSCPKYFLDEMTQEIRKTICWMENVQKKN